MEKKIILLYVGFSLMFIISTIILSFGIVYRNTSCSFEFFMGICPIMTSTGGGRMIIVLFLMFYHYRIYKEFEKKPIDKSN